MSSSLFPGSLSVFVLCSVRQLCYSLHSSSLRQWRRWYSMLFFFFFFAPPQSLAQHWSRQTGLYRCLCSAHNAEGCLTEKVTDCSCKRLKDVRMLCVLICWYCLYSTRIFTMLELNCEYFHSQPTEWGRTEVQVFSTIFISFIHKYIWIQAQSPALFYFQCIYLVFLEFVSDKQNKLFIIIHNYT